MGSKYTELTDRDSSIARVVALRLALRTPQVSLNTSEYKLTCIDLTGLAYVR